MGNMDATTYTYDSFNAAFNSNPALKNIVDNYNGEEIVLHKDKEVAKKSDGNDDVEKMAKRATDLKDL